MKYHIMLARNTYYPYSLDVFNESCITVIVKKELARQYFVRYSLQCSYLAQMIQHLLKFNFVRELKKGIFGAFNYLASPFYLFVKKGFFARFHLFLKSSEWLVPANISSMHDKLCKEKWVIV